MKHEARNGRKTNTSIRISSIEAHPNDGRNNEHISLFGRILISLPKHPLGFHLESQIFPEAMTTGNKHGRLILSSNESVKKSREHIKQLVQVQHIHMLVEVRIGKENWEHVLPHSHHGRPQPANPSPK